MPCPLCDHSRHKDAPCKTYVAGEGYCVCAGALPGTVSHGIITHIPGAALKRMHLSETKAFVEKALKGAGKPPDRVRQAMRAARE